MNRPHQWQKTCRSLLFLAILLGILGSQCTGNPTEAATPSVFQEKPQASPTPTSLPTSAPTLPIDVLDDGKPLAPKIMNWLPGEAQTMALNGVLEIEFDQAMNKEITGKALVVTDSSNQPVAGTISWPSQRILRFSPDKPLNADSTYFASLSASAANIMGKTIAEPVTFSLTTAGKLEVTQVFPLDGTEQIDVNSPISVIFNRPVVPLMINKEQTELPNPLIIDPPVKGKGEWISTSVFSYTPDENLMSGTTYKITIKAGLTDVSKAKDSELQNDVTWHFSTATPTIEAILLDKEEVNPKNTSVNIPLKASFGFRFSQEMEPDSVEKAITLMSESDKKTIPFNTQWEHNNSQITITPVNLLALENSYIITINSDAKAKDGGKLASEFSWNFWTVPPPFIVSTNPDNGTTQDQFSNVLRIMFAAPMDINSFKDRIIVKPETDEKINHYYNEHTKTLNIYGFKPSTSYEVRILPGMADPYGNRINNEKVIRFKTGTLRPYANLVMPGNPTIIRANGPQDFYASFINLTSINLSLYRLDNETFMRLLTDWDARSKFIPEEKARVWHLTERPNAKTNENGYARYTLRNESDEPLPSGFYYLGMNYEPNPNKSKAKFSENQLLIISDANLTFKLGANESLAWLTDLETGEPIANIPLAIYTKDFKEIASGKTGSDGVLHVDLPPLDTGYSEYFVMTRDEKRFALASNYWGSGDYNYERQAWMGMNHSPDKPKAYIYSDRPIYRPGQPVYFKGIVRIENDAIYSLPKQEKVHVTISNYEEVVFEEDFNLTSFGSFNGKFTLDNNAALGDYYLSIRFPGADTEMGSLSFGVAEYRRLEFETSVTAKNKNILVGENVNVDVAAEYLSGGVVSNGKVNWVLNETPYIFLPEDEKFANFNFVDDAMMADYEYLYTTTIAEGVSVLNNEGKQALSIPPGIKKHKFGQQFTFEATVSDLAENAVSGRDRIIAHLSQVYAGVRSKAYVGNVNEEQTFELVAIDWNSKPIAGQKINVEIVESRWYSVQEQDESGHITWKTTEEEVPITAFEAVKTDPNGLASVSFVPAKGGVYKAKVTTLDGKGNKSQSSASLWVAGDKFISWRREEGRTLKPVADRSSYKVGDTAEILIPSTFEGPAYALITIERSRIRKWEVLKLENNSTVYKIPITKDMAPNVFATILIVKGIDQKNPKPDYLIGMVELKVDTSLQTIKVEVIPDKKEAGPRDKVAFTVRTTDMQGTPVNAEVSLSLSDLGTLLLREPNSIPIMDYFYDKRHVEIVTIVPIHLLIDEFNTDIAKHIAARGEGMGSGGGKGGGLLGVMEVRGYFPDTAYWSAHIVTGKDGEETVNVTLPDNLTTWRMDARAVTEDTRVGQTTVDLLSTKPLLVRPQTPRFFVEDDHVRIGMAVHNNTNQTMIVDTKLDAEGVKLQSQAAQQINISAMSQAYVSWDTIVETGISQVNLVFKANSGSYSDASRPSVGAMPDQGIPVYHYEAPETVGTSGLLDKATTITEAISLPETLGENPGELNIKLAPSLAAGMVDGLKYLEHYPYECTEQTISRFLPNVLTTHALKDTGIHNPELEARLKEQVNTGLQKLYNQQNADGGWGWWGNQESHMLTTAYVVLGLVEAKDADYSVNNGVMENGIQYIKSALKPLDEFTSTYERNRQAFLLYVLAKAKKADVSNTVQLYEQREKLSLYARAFLAQTLAMAINDKEDIRVKNLVSDLSGAAIMTATGTHWEEKERDDWNWNTDLRTTAIVLKTLIMIDKDNRLNASTVRWLMSHRDAGHWRSTQETAWTLMALTDWLVASQELKADYLFAVALNGNRLGDGKAKQDTIDKVVELRAQVADLLKDAPNRLTIARNDGPGSLYYTAHLTVSLPVAEIKPLDRGIVLSREYYSLDNLDKPITSAQWGDRLLVRLTVVAPTDLQYVIIDDPLPAGLEIIDQSLQTSEQELAPEELSKSFLRHGWGRWYFNHVENRDEKLVLSATDLPRGTYVYTYLARATTVGKFQVIPPTGQEFYFPEVYGRGSGSSFEVEENLR